MMKFFILIFCSLSLICCQKMKPKKNPDTFYKENDLQFTFLIFNTKKVDDFFEIYKPLEFKNPKVKNECQSLLKVVFDVDNSELDNYKNNTGNISVEDFQLAKEVVEAGWSIEGESSVGCLEYLFFNKTLPVKFQKKWVQTMSGNFKFNISFLSLLRKRNKFFDDLIYSGSQSNDERLLVFFNDFVTSNITPEMASNIKETIIRDNSFNDIRFKTDKDIFLEFLNMTIKNKWKLILLDWN